MPRIRTIKPSFWSSPEVVRLSRDARLLAVGLISFADDDGRFLAAVNAINGYAFPNDDLPPNRVTKWLNECEDVGFIHRYTVGGMTLGVIPTWHRHQVINKYTPSQLPAPDIECVPRGGKDKE